MGYFLTFDVGTTAMKCILFDKSFGELFYANREYSIDAPREGIAEISADTYFNTFADCISDMRTAGINLSDIGSVTFTTQGETLIPVDEGGEPLCPAIVWLDTRAAAEADLIRTKIDRAYMYSHTGLCDIDGALPAAKILWLEKNRPDIYEKTHKFLLLEDYLIYRLTGRFVSERSLQSSTGWYDIIREDYFPDMLAAAKIPKTKLPEVLPCGTVVGKVCGRISKELGLSPDTLVITGAMDQISSAVAIGNVREGIFTETTGTALVIGVTAEKPVFDIEMPITVYKHYDSKFIYMPYSPTAGMTLKWFKDKIMPYAQSEGEKAGISAYEYIDRVAEGAAPGSGGLIMLPQISECGAFIGLNLSTGTPELARSVLEGVSFMLRGIAEQIEARGIKIERIYSLGGGSYSPLWCKIKADVCKKPIVCIKYAQTTALGAAVLASVALGVYPSIEAAISQYDIIGRMLTPDSENLEKYDLAYKKYNNYLQKVEGQL